MIRKFLFLLLFVAGFQMAQAQVKLPASVDAATKAFTAPPAIGDVNKTSSSITDLLTSKLGLNSTQKTGTLGAITGFLKDKSGILGLAKTDQAGYLSKFSGLQSGLFGKLKGIFGAAKFANFLKLKPAAGSTGNVLSNLFF